MSQAPSASSPVRQLALELYRILPAFAMCVAAFAIVLTLVQLATSPRQKASPPAAATVPVAAIGPAQVAVATSAPVPEATAMTEQTPAVAQISVTQTSATPAAPVESPAPGPRPSAPPQPAAAEPPPPATLDVTLLNSRAVRAQGRILEPNSQVEYWFLIREPGRSGVYRQGPASVSPDGSYLYNLSLLPLSSGPDSVTLASVPRDVSIAWLGQAIRSGTWLPVVDVRPENGIEFLSEVSF